MILNQGEFGRIMENELEVLKRRKEDAPRPSDPVVGCCKEDKWETGTSGETAVLFRAGSWGEHSGVR